MEDRNGVVIQVKSRQQRWQLLCTLASQGWDQNEPKPN